MNATAPPGETIHSALEMACRAPSVHNSQPWRWKIAPHSLHLYADRGRLLHTLDPTGREMVLSCGAALHHARIAFPSLGWHTTVHRTPNPAEPDHLASIEFTPTRPDDIDVHTLALANAITTRHTDRRPFLPDPVPDRLVTGLTDAARAEDGMVALAADDRSRRELLLAIEQAGSTQRDSADYRAELIAWSGAHLPFAEGVPSRTIPASDDYRRGMPERDFSVAATGELPVPVLDDGALLAVLASRDDSIGDWLRTGEALSAVLLAGTRAGLATCPLSQIAEVAEVRADIRKKMLHDTAWPQIALRIGWPATAEFPAPPTPRRPIGESIEPLAPRP
jgi:nitroreductase